MKRIKRTFTQDERVLVFDLWKQGAGFSDIGRIIEAKPGSVFTILRENGGITPRTRHRNISHLTLSEREEIRVSLSAKMSIRAIARKLGRSPSTISREVARNRGRRYYKAVDADNRAKRMAKRPKLGVLELYPELKKLVIEKLELKWSPEQISDWLRVEYSRSKKMQVSHETIYKSLYVRARNIIHHCLTEHLRRKRPMRHSRFHTRKGDRGSINIVNGVSIHERSKQKIFALRNRTAHNKHVTFDHWDTNAAHLRPFVPVSLKLSYSYAFTLVWVKSYIIDNNSFL